LGPGKTGQQRRAIVSGEIDAVFERVPKYRPENFQVAPFALHDKRPVDAGDGGQERSAVPRDDQCQICAREFFSQRSNYWRGQNQIADAFDLKKENIHENRSRTAKIETEHIKSRRMAFSA
jgi:hypothetical protein